MASQLSTVFLGVVLVVAFISSCESRAIRQKRGGDDVNLNGNPVDFDSSKSNDLDIGPNNFNNGNSRARGNRNCRNRQTNGGAGGNAKGGNNPMDTTVQNARGGRGGNTVNNVGCGANGGQGGYAFAGKNGGANGGQGGISVVADHADGVIAAAFLTGSR